MEAENTAKAVEQRAAAAAATTGHRYNPVTVANRIDTLEAEQRADQRRLDGHRRTLFTDAEGIESLWEASSALVDHPPPLHRYAPGSYGPQKMHELIAPRRWWLPATDAS